MSDVRLGHAPTVLHCVLCVWIENNCHTVPCTYSILEVDLFDPPSRLPFQSHAIVFSHFLSDILGYPSVQRTVGFSKTSSYFFGRVC